MSQSDDNKTPRILQQQQPSRDGSDPEQQRAGGADFQSSRASGSQVEGEGSYTATRNYQKDIKDYMDKGRVQSDMEASRPRSESEAREMEEAEREGKSHAKGERNS